MRELVLIAGLAACVNAHVVQCDDGTICPLDLVCDPAHHQCVRGTQLTSCIDKPNETRCPVLGDFDGICVDEVCVIPLCGDAILTPPEACDPEIAAPPGGWTCRDAGFHEASAVICDPVTCEWDGPCVEKCGDGIINGPELCESGIDVGNTCIDYGYDRGSISCAACRPEFSACGVIGWTSTPLGRGAFDTFDAEAFDKAIYLATHAADGIHVVRYEAGIATEIGAFPDLGIFSSGPLEISVVADNDLWVLSVNGSDGRLVHWDGAMWTEVAQVPNARSLVVAGGTIWIGVLGKVVRSSTTAPATFIDETVPVDAVRLGVWPGGYASGDTRLAKFDGTSWSEVTLPATPTAIQMVTVVNDDVFLAVKRGNVAELWQQSGGTWTMRTLPYVNATTPSQLDVVDLVVKSDGDIYALVSTFAHRIAFVAHWDGSHWAKLDDFPKINPDALALVDTPSGSREIVGFGNGLAFTFEGSAWSTPGLPLSSTYSLFAAGERLFATVQGNPVARFDDESWPSVPNAPVDMAFGGGIGDHAYVVSKNFDALGRFDGTSWTTVAAPQRLQGALAARAIDDVFVGVSNVNGSEGIIHFDGTAFAGYETLSTYPISIACNPTDCYAVLANGSTWWKSGSTAWTRIMVGFGDVNNAGYGSSVWTAPGGETVFGSIDGRLARGIGTTWMPPDTVAGTPITAIGGDAVDDLVLVTQGPGQPAALLYWDGAAATSIRVPMSIVVRQLVVAHDLFITGSGAVGNPIVRLRRVAPW